MNAKNSEQSHGMKDPGGEFQDFHRRGADWLREVRRQQGQGGNNGVAALQTSMPQKQPRTYPVSEAARMVGTTDQTLRNLEGREDFDLPSRDNNQRRRYTLAQINLARDLLGKRPSRPEGSRPIRQVIFNAKGGVAKTTTAIHLAQKVALEGYRCLLIDLDPQGSATLNFGFLPNVDVVSNEDEDHTIYPALIEDPELIRGVIQKSYFDGVDIIPACLGLDDAEDALAQDSDKEAPELGWVLSRIDQTLRVVEDNYDVIVMDCGPSIRMLATNAVQASNAMVVPIPPAMQDFGSSVTLNRVLSRLFHVIPDKTFDLFRVLLTSYEEGQETAKMESLLRNVYGDYVFVPHVVDSVEIQRAASALGSIYDIETPWGDPDSYKRALKSVDQVNLEILNLYQQIWQAQALAAEEDKEKED